MESLARIKVCGMRDCENIEQVASLGVDYLGFIFFPTSPRYVGDDFVVSAEKQTFQSVGVFVDEPIQSVVEKAVQFKLDFVQLHGDESVATCEKLSDRGLRIIKVFPVDEGFDFRKTEPFNDVADYFLFDTKGTRRGGNGKAFDWQLLSKFNQRKPFFLSGGLSPENLSQVYALKDMNIHAFDFNSGLEISPGIKDIQKLKSVQQTLKELL